MRIGITDNLKPNFSLYVDWLKRAEPNLVAMKLSYLQENLHELDACDGLLLTGGGDVDPRRYNRAEAAGAVQGVDARRDDFEYRVIDRVKDLGIPVLGICRGLQIVNVAFGGSLIADLVGAGFRDHRPAAGEELRHDVAIVQGTMLARIVGGSAAEVNSSHHQAAGSVGTGLKVSATSPDGVVEGLEWDDPAGKQFLLLVQWHPERMKDVENPASKNVLQTFLLKVKASKTSMKV